MDDDAATKTVVQAISPLDWRDNSAAGSHGMRAGEQRGISYAYRCGAPVYYGRAIAKYRMGQQKASLSDLDRAIQLDPKNPQYTQMRAVISAGKK